MGSDRSIRWEVTEYRPDQRYGVRGLGGPVRAHVTMDVSPEQHGGRHPAELPASSSKGTAWAGSSRRSLERVPALTFPPR